MFRTVKAYPITIPRATWWQKDYPKKLCLCLCR